MNEHTLLDAFGDIDPSYITEAQAAYEKTKAKKARNKKIFMTVIPIAACLVIVSGVVLATGGHLDGDAAMMSGTSYSETAASEPDMEPEEAATEQMPEDAEEAYYEDTAAEEMMTEDTAAEEAMTEEVAAEAAMTEETAAEDTSAYTADAEDTEEAYYEGESAEAATAPETVAEASEPLDTEVSNEAVAEASEPLDAADANESSEEAASFVGEGMEAANVNNGTGAAGLIIKPAKAQKAAANAAQKGQDNRAEYAAYSDNVLTIYLPADISADAGYTLSRLRGGKYTELDPDTMKLPELIGRGEKSKDGLVCYEGDFTAEPLNKGDYKIEIGGIRISFTVE